MDNSTTDRYAAQYEFDERAKEAIRAQQRKESGNMVESFNQRTSDRLQAEPSESGDK